MANQDTIQSNSTGLFKAYHGNEGLRAVPQDAVWYEKEPNEYGDFGQTTNKVSRQPISSGRMKKKPTVVGFDATAGYTTDVTAENLRQDMEDFMFADTRSKGRLKSTSIAVDGYVVASGGAVFKNRNIIYVEGESATAVNLGLKVLLLDGAANKINFAGLVADGAAKTTVTKVGHQFASGDLEVVTTDGYPTLVSAADNFVNLGLLPGEIIYIGDDASSHSFNEPVNRGWARVFKVEAGVLTLDKTDAEFVDDDGAAKTIRIYFGEVLKNEKSTLLQKTKYSAFRRTLGVPDPDTGKVQSEFILGCVANEATFSIPEEDKVTVELAYLGRVRKLFKDDSLADPDGTFVGVNEEDAINSTSDSQRLRMAVYNGIDDPGGVTSAPVPIIPAFTEFEMVINNNVSVNKAITFMGAYGLTPGFFDVMCTATGYFVDLGSLQAIDDNADVTIMYTASKQNKGVAWDIPLVGLSTDGPSIEVNEPITIELDAEAADGSKYNPRFNHALMMCFYSYLPTVAND